MKNLIAILAVLLIASGAMADTFKIHRKHFDVGPNPCAIVAQDLNGDGLPEIITADRGEMTDPEEERPGNNELSILLGLGSLAYMKLTPLRSGFAPYDIEIANIDDLKAPDIVVCSFHAARNRDISLFRNLGENLFESSHFTVSDNDIDYTKVRDGDNQPIFTTPGFTSIVVGDKNDFNHDGLRDVVATGWGSDVIAFFPGTADTYFGSPKLTKAPGGPRDIVAMDFDADGETDLATVMYNTSELNLWKGDGNGGFEPIEHFQTHGRLPSVIKIADINGDGKQDLVVSHSYTDDSIVIFYGDRPFQFATFQEVMIGSNRDIMEHEIRDIIVTDLNGDKRQDIAAACFESGTVKVLLNSAKKSSIPQTFKTETYEFKEARPRALCVADFDQNGSKDIAVALWESNTVSLLLGK